VIEKYPQQVKIVFKNFPIKSHKNAERAAEAALAAQEQGKFWEMHDLLFDNYNKLNESVYEQLANQLDLDFEKFQKDMRSNKVKRQIQIDMRDANRANVTGTPTIFINGRRLKRRSMEGFSSIIDEELEKLKAAQEQPAEGQAPSTKTQ
jgi:protein-disulfide isomerase